MSCLCKRYLRMVSNHSGFFDGRKAPTLTPETKWKSLAPKKGRFLGCRAVVFIKLHFLSTTILACQSSSLQIVQFDKK